MWSFSLDGWQEALKEFAVSLVKTILVAGGSYIALRLATISIPLTDHNYELYTALIALGRAAVSSFLVFVNTFPSTSATPAVDQQNAIA